MYELEDHKCCAGEQGWVIQAEIVPYDSSANNPDHDEGTDECEALKDRDWGYRVLFFFGMLRQTQAPFFSQGQFRYITSNYSIPSISCRHGGIWVEQELKRHIFFSNSFYPYPEGNVSNSEHQLKALLYNSHPDEIVNTSADFITLWSKGGCRLYDGLVRFLAYPNRPGSIKFIEVPSKMVGLILSGQIVIKIDPFRRPPDGAFDSARELGEIYEDESYISERFRETRPGHSLVSANYQPTITKKADICDRPDNNPNFNPLDSRLVKRKDFFCGCGTCEKRCGNCCIDLTDVAQKALAFGESLIS